MKFQTSQMGSTCTTPIMYSTDFAQLDQISLFYHCLLHTKHVQAHVTARFGLSVFRGVIPSFAIFKNNLNSNQLFNCAALYMRIILFYNIHTNLWNIDEKNCVVELQNHISVCRTCTCMSAYTRCIFYTIN